MRTLALIARHPGLDRNAFRSHYEHEHVPLALPLLEGLTRYVRNHVLSSIWGKEPSFDVLTEFSYRDAEAFEAVLNRLASPEGAEIAQDELRFMDKERNVFFGVEERDAWGSEDSANSHKVALLALRQSREGFEHRISAFQDFLRERFSNTQGWTLWQTRALGAEPPVEAVAFVWFAPGSIDLSRFEGLDAVLGEGFILSVEEVQS
ncbi:EthD domain-containing protein [Myxococcota bacterium]|nr:EthD domain-containing protein [Myxococcota bacterium]